MEPEYILSAIKEKIMTSEGCTLCNCLLISSDEKFTIKNDSRMSSVLARSYRRLLLGTWYLPGGHNLNPVSIQTKVMTAMQSRDANSPILIHLTESYSTIQNRLGISSNIVWLY